jgi:hypothetical protein
MDVWSDRRPEGAGAFGPVHMYYGRYANRPPFPPWALDPVYISFKIKNAKRLMTSSLNRFLALLENGVENRTENYNEGYDDVLQSISYAIRSGDVKNISELDELINQMDAYAEDFDGEFGAGYQDAVNRCFKALEMSA